MRPLDLVIFDCDGVLIDSEMISARMLVRELSRLGVSVDLAYVARHFLGRSYPVVIAQVRDEFGLTLPDAFEETYRAALLDAFARELQVMPHVTGVMDELAVPFCVATSSTPRRAAASLRMVGLGHLVGPRLFTASEVARGKPAPDLFLHVARRLDVSPSRCVVIEDSEMGLRAARAAGMAAWRFTGGSHLTEGVAEEPPDAHPDRSFASFAEFFSIAPELRRAS